MALRILGLGVDVVGVDRVERAVARLGEGFLEEFLRPSETGQCFRSRQPLSSCASVFAAKEALFKALGTGRSGALRWKDVEVSLRGGTGPSLSLTGETSRAAAELGVRRVHLDLARSRDAEGPGLAVALVVLEG